MIEEEASPDLGMPSDDVEHIYIISEDTLVRVDISVPIKIPTDFMRSHTPTPSTPSSLRERQPRYQTSRCAGVCVARGGEAQLGCEIRQKDMLTTRAFRGIFVPRK